MTDQSALPELPADTLEFKDWPHLVPVRVRDAVSLLWAENPKLHDLGAVIHSIHVHGFQELPKFDGNLPSIRGDPGAIKAGNGRVEALDAMERGDYELPRGLAVERKTGYWVLPVLAGTDAVSVNMARAYAVDSNNLTMAGGDFAVWDVARMWDAGYPELLQRLAEADTLPVSVDGDDVDAVIRFAAEPEAPLEFTSYDDDIDVEHRCPKCGYEWSGNAT